MTRKSKKGKQASEQVRESEHADQNHQRGGNHDHYSFGVMIKTVTGEVHQLDMDCPSKEGVFHALQQAVEREMQVPILRQRFFLDGGRTVLANTAQLQSAIAALHGGSNRLVLQLIPKLYGFSLCPAHPEYELKILCVPCGRLLCQKCLFRHISRTNACCRHALANLEDEQQFGEAMNPILHQADAQLNRSLKLSTDEAAENLAQCYKKLAQASSGKRRYVKDLFKLSVAVVQKASRGAIRTTGEAAAWLRLSHRGGVHPSPRSTNEAGSDEDEEYEEEEDEEEGVEDAYSLTFIALPQDQESKPFPLCERHHRLQKTVFCMQCADTMCLKCFALHANKVKGHQCADMEDAEQFTGMVRKRFRVIDAQLEEKVDELRQSAAESLHRFRCALGQLLPAWEQYLDSLKRQIKAEARQIQRKGTSTPADALQWLLGAESSETAALQGALEDMRIHEEEENNNDDDNDDDEEEEEDGEEELLLLCPQGHILDRVDGDGRGNWVCDGCQYQFDADEEDVLQCSRCRHDLCGSCEYEQRMYLYTLLPPPVEVPISLRFASIVGEPLSTQFGLFTSVSASRLDLAERLLSVVGEAIVKHHCVQTGNSFVLIERKQHLISKWRPFSFSIFGLPPPKADGQAGPSGLTASTNSSELKTLRKGYTYEIRPFIPPRFGEVTIPCGFGDRTQPFLTQPHGNPFLFNIGKQESCQSVKKRLLVATRLKEKDLEGVEKHFEFMIYTYCLMSLPDFNFALHAYISGATPSENSPTHAMLQRKMPKE